MANKNCTIIFREIILSLYVSKFHLENKHHVPSFKLQILFTSENTIEIYKDVIINSDNWFSILSIRKWAASLDFMFSIFLYIWRQYLILNRFQITL